MVIGMRDFIRSIPAVAAELATLAAGFAVFLLALVACTP